MPASTLLLASGLSLARGNSFGRQLRLLAGRLAARGRRCVLAGTGAPRQLAGGAADLPRLDAAALTALCGGRDPDAAILLGYPDQFPVMREAGCPCYLWAQFSRPPDRAALGRAAVVPLTATTRALAARAGAGTIGPTIPHGVDTSVFCPPTGDERAAARAALGAGAAVPLLGTVAANTTRKRFDRLVEALALLDDRSARLVIKTDRATAPGGFDIPALAARHGVTGRVAVITGELPEGELARLYGALDLYVHAAEWEGFGLPVVEALSCAVPVVAAATQGPGEIVPYDEGLVDQGSWVNEGPTRLFHVDPAAHAAAAGRVLGDPALAARLAAAGHAAAVSRYDIDTVASLWLALLDSGGSRGAT
jgi:glycosyltransferase involved in cell wall biosynthesis